MKGFSRVLDARPGESATGEYRPMPDTMLENLEVSRWVFAATGAPAPAPALTDDVLYVEDLVRLDVLSLETQLQWCLYHLNHSLNHSWMGLHQALTLAEELQVQIYISYDRWLYTAEPEEQPEAFDLDRQLSTILSELGELEVELSQVGEDCSGWVYPETKNGKVYYRYMHYTDGCRLRKSCTVYPGDLAGYQERIRNRKLRKRLEREINKRLQIQSNLNRAIQGRAEPLLHAGENWVWRLSDPASKQAKKISYSCYFEMPGSRGRPKHSKILPELRFHAGSSNATSAAIAFDSATRMAEFLNRFSPGRIPSPTILQGIRNMIASGASLARY